MNSFRIAHGILLVWILYGIVIMATSALPAFPGQKVSAPRPRAAGAEPCTWSRT